MIDLAVCRVDRKAIPLGERASFTAAAETLSETLFARALMHGSDLVVLNTCERFEVYFRDAGEYVDARLRASPIAADTLVSRGDHAVRHLFRVASGLESRIPGEPHVLGQVRVALDAATQRGTAARAFVDVFRRALECGRRVRAIVPFGPDAAGYSSRVVDRLRAELGTLDVRSVLVVGTGSLASDVARLVRDAGVGGLTIAGRHEARVAQLASELGAQGLVLSSLHSTQQRFDAIVTAVSVATPIVDADAVRRTGASVVIDLGVSPNVDPGVRLISGVTVWGLDDLGAAAVRATSLAHASAVVERELVRYRTSRASTATAIADLLAAS